MTFKTPSFFLAFLSPLRIWLQKVMTGVSVFFLFWQAAARNDWAATTGETRSSKISETWRGIESFGTRQVDSTRTRVLVKGCFFKGCNNCVSLVNPSLTEFHPDVFVGVRVPQGVVVIAVTHERKDNVRKDGLEVRFKQLPRISMVHSERKGMLKRERERGREREREREGERERKGGSEREVWAHTEERSYSTHIHWHLVNLRFHKIVKNSLNNPRRDIVALPLDL